MPTDIEALLTDLTLEEKVAIVGGEDFWHNHGVERLGIGQVKVTDGPNGARGDALFGTGSKTVCAPCGSALGATWDPDLVERVGAMLGHQAGTKGAHVLLAPTINLHRHPFGGRVFESYSEDPQLTARLAVGFVRGCQSQGVATTPKHFAGNDSEYQRMTINSVIDDRALRELYLVPFEAVVAAGAWGLMSAYNRLNGSYCSDSHELLTTLLRQEWGFDGFVVSDWFGTHSTVEAANAGLDLEMPGPAHYFSERLVEAVRSGEVEAAQLDEMVRRLLRVAQRTGALGAAAPVDEREVDLAEHRELCREASAASITLLKNDPAVLPLDAARLSKLAVLGPNADRVCIMGGGSANVNAHYRVSPLAAIHAAVGDDVEISHEPGGSNHKFLPPLGAPLVTTPDGEPGVAVEYFGTSDLTGEAVRVETVENSRFRWIGRTPDGVDPSRFSMRARMIVEVEATARYDLGLIVLGQARVSVDGEPLLDAWDTQPPRGEAVLGMASEEITVTRELVAGMPVEVVVEYSNAPTPGFGACYFGGRPVDDEEALVRAEAAARDADAAIVVVGTDDEWETEGVDRTMFELPGRQAELIERVAAANPRTIVVLNAASPVATDWAASVPAVLVTWFGGQEMAGALADVLFGMSDPGGRLPTTFPVSLDDVPCRFDYPGEAGAVRYSDGVFAGYRGYDARGVEPAFCFGHGLSYTSFEMERLTLSVDEVSDAGDMEAQAAVQVTVRVTNTGTRPGTEVVQCYVAPPSGPLLRPPRELKAFTKVALDPGKHTTVTLDLDRRSLAAWDPRKGEWKVQAGIYRIEIGRSSRDIVADVELTVRG